MTIAHDPASATDAPAPPTRTVRVRLLLEPPENDAAPSSAATFDVPYGTPVAHLFDKHLPAERQPPLAAMVHNRCVTLYTPLTSDTDVRPIDYTMRLGVLVFRRTATLMMLEAVRELFGAARVAIGQAQGNGYYYGIHTAQPFSAAQTAQLERRMREMVAQDVPLTIETLSIEEARSIFAGNASKLSLLKTTTATAVRVVRLGKTCDLHRFPVAPRTSLIDTFDLVHEPADDTGVAGVLLRFPERRTPTVLAPFVESAQLVDTYREARNWLSILGVEAVGQLNEHTLRGEAGELIRIAEGLHEKKIAHIADAICHSRAQEPVRLVLIAGPSSSGKTTFSKRLSLQLRVNGVRPVALSTDNFYVDRDDTPRDEDGNFDFEAIEAIDLELFNNVLAGLLRGERVLTPRFDFAAGKRRSVERWIPMRLDDEQVLMVEGIHGLNPRLTEAVAEQQKYKIYINALTQLRIDDHNRIFTSDTRFLRRIVRDRFFRGYSAAQTIDVWPRVRRGEMRNIYPFQDEADVTFNSALVYEQAVLRLYAERFLLEVPQDHAAYVDAYRLLRFVELFVPMFDESIPQTSLLREFIGGSFFNY